MEEIGLALYDDDRRLSEEMLLEARTWLGADEYARVSRQGREMPISAAVAAAENALAAR